MGAFCWKDCQKRRNEKRRIRQDAKTARVKSRTARQLGKAEFGIDTASNIARSGFNAYSQVGSAKYNALGRIGQSLSFGLPSANAMLDQNIPVSGSNKYGAEASQGFVPIVLAVGAVLFSLLSFGGLFSKKRRR